MSSPSEHKGLSYKDAGVDIDAGNALVDAIKPLAKATNRPGTVSGLGGFGALFDLKAAGYRDPILVSATDGVGTKLKIAIETECHDTVGIDLVAMCVNDLVVQGAEPLFFLDYFATGKLATGVAASVIAGIAEGCKQAGCALIGGETAEMPGMYAKGEYDLAGFAVGAMERGKELIGDGVKAGDTVLGLASSGVHSNGYSLVRKIIETAGLSWSDPAPFDPSKSLGQALMEPTRIYAKACLAAIGTGKVKALSHITGGGLLENIPRVLPEGVAVSLDAALWTRPAVFDWLQKVGGVEAMEMMRTFNNGIGMAVIVAAEDSDEVQAAFAAAGEKTFPIGVVTEGHGEVTIANAARP